jgi:hypothetical protein
LIRTRESFDQSWKKCWIKIFWNQVSVYRWNKNSFNIFWLERHTIKREHLSHWSMEWKKGRERGSHQNIFEKIKNNNPGMYIRNEIGSRVWSWFGLSLVHPLASSATQTMPPGVPRTPLLHYISVLVCCGPKRVRTTVGNIWVCSWPHVWAYCLWWQWLTRISCQIRGSTLRVSLGIVRINSKYLSYTYHWMLLYFLWSTQQLKRYPLKIYSTREVIT